MVLLVQVVMNKPWIASFIQNRIQNLVIYLNFFFKKYSFVSP